MLCKAIIRRFKCTLNFGLVSINCPKEGSRSPELSESIYIAVSDYESLRLCTVCCSSKLINTPHNGARSPHLPHPSHNKYRIKGLCEFSVPNEPLDQGYLPLRRYSLGSELLIQGVIPHVPLINRVDSIESVTLLNLHQSLFLKR